MTQSQQFHFILYIFHRLFGVLSDRLCSTSIRLPFCSAVCLLNSNGLYLCVTILNLSISLGVTPTEFVSDWIFKNEDISPLICGLLPKVCILIHSPFAANLRQTIYSVILRQSEFKMLMKAFLFSCCVAKCLTTARVPRVIVSGLT